jgi:hypothetical protein
MIGRKHVTVVAPETMPLERLEAEITELAGQLAAAECRWPLLIAEFDRRDGHAHWGCQSCAYWLSWHCGLDVRAVQERVRVAHALAGLPLVTEHFAAGRLSYSKVRAITRVGAADNEAKLVDLALHSTAAQLERSVRAYRTVLDLDGETETDVASAQHMARYLRFEWAEDGSLEGRFRLSQEAGAILLKSIEIARAHVPPEPVPDDEVRSAERTSEPAATNSDALILLAETFLTHAAPEHMGNRFQVAVNVDAGVLADDDVDGICELDDGPALAPETVRRISCDASIVEATDSAVDRAWKKAPAIPASTRRAVRRRDRGCRFPGCGRRAFTQVHHVRHHARGGDNALTNLVELCWFHHRLVHEGGWNVRLDSHGEVLAIRPNGNVLPRPRPPTPADGHAVERHNARVGLTIGPKTIIPRWYGDPLDLPDVVDALLTARRRN